MISARPAGYIIVHVLLPQYGELFVMRYDGTRVQQLTDKQWEDGTPACQPGITRTSKSR